MLDACSERAGRADSGAGPGRSHHQPEREGVVFDRAHLRRLGWAPPAIRLGSAAAAPAFAPPTRTGEEPEVRRRTGLILDPYFRAHRR